MNASTALIWLLALPLVASAGRVPVGAHRRCGWRGRRHRRAGWPRSRWRRRRPAVGRRPGGPPGGAGVRGAGEIGLRMDGVGLLLAATVLGLTFVVSLFSIPYMRRRGGRGEVLRPAGRDGRLDDRPRLRRRPIQPVGLVRGDGRHVVPARRVLPRAEGLARGGREVPGAVGGRLGARPDRDRAGLRAHRHARLSEILAVVSSTGATPGLLAAGALFLIGFGVKTALVPLHTWLPDAHSMAPSGISAMLSGVVIEAGLIAMLRSLGGAGPGGQHVGRPDPRLRRAQHDRRQPDGAAADAGQAAARLLERQPHGLHAARVRRRGGLRHRQRRGGRLLPPGQPRDDEGARLPGGRRPALLAARSRTGATSR